MPSGLALSQERRRRSFLSGVVERDSNSLALEASLDQVANVESWPEGMLSPASTGVDGDAEKIMNLAGSHAPQSAAPAGFHKPIVPPKRFAIVEAGVYRSSTFSATHFEFIKSLNIKTIVSLSPEVTIRTVQSFVRENGIRHVHLGLKFWQPSSWKPMSEEAVKEALEIVLNVNFHPVMVMCTSGVSQTGTLVACLRKMQDWAFSSIIQELRSFEGRTRLHTRYLNEHFVERFDTDLITPPLDAAAPAWFGRHVKDFEKERSELRALKIAREKRGGIKLRFVDSDAVETSCGSNESVDGNRVDGDEPEDQTPSSSLTEHYYRFSSGPLCIDRKYTYI